MTWESRCLNDLCSFITDGKHGDCQNEPDSGYYFISAKDVYDGKIHYENARQITQSDFAETHRRTDLKPGDILLTNSGTIGRLAIASDIETTSKTTFQKSVAILKPISDIILPEFLYYSLAFNTKSLENAAGGAAQKNLLLGELRRFVLSVPIISTQKKIVDILAAYDSLIENNRRRTQLLEQSARLLYREWFVYLHFPGHEHVRIIDGVPKGWEKSTVGEKVVLNYGKALNADDRIEGSYPVYGSSGVIGTHEKPLVKGPGIIVGRKGNVGSVFWSHKDFYPIDTVYFIDTETSNYYLFHTLQNMQFINSDGAVPGLNRNFAYSRPYVLPEHKLLLLFEENVLPMHTQIHKLKAYNEKLIEACDILLPRLMNGEIIV